jgi:hypothetical protein
MRPLDDVFRRVSRLALDTAPVIYLIERHPRYDDLVTDVFRRISDGTISGVTSVIH